MEVILLIVMFIIELSKYWISTVVFFEVKVKRKLIALFGISVYLLLVINEKIEENRTHIVMFGIVVIVLIATIKDVWKQKIKIVLMNVVLITCLDELIGIPMEYVWRRYNGMVSTFDLIYLSGSISSLVLIIIAAKIKQRSVFSKARFKVIARKSVEILMPLMALFLSFTVAGLNYAEEYVYDEKFIVFANIVSIISFICIFMLIGIMIYFKSTNEKMEKLIQTERNLKNIQLNYYNTMLEREEDTRKYRHDINNHLICLNELFNEGEVELISDYVNEMQIHINTIGQKVYQMGNEILDAILNYHIPMLDTSVKMEIVGKCMKELGISNVDLCTIFSNLVQNAVEELNEKSCKEKFLKIEVNTGLEYLKIEIINSISDESLKKDSILKTNKNDELNHGLGLINVKETIQKNRGKFTTNICDKKFIATVILKL